MGSDEEASMDMVQNRMKTRLNILWDKNGGFDLVGRNSLITSQSVSGGFLVDECMLTHARSTIS